ncbi:UNVERIFIED_CONTAM: hypothetical protein FKN15_026266 [Acipenser sinensis]
MSGFHRCVTCGTKLPANDPHEDCVSCLGPEHAACTLADKAFCTSCASFQMRTLRRRARRAIGDHSPSSGSSHTLSAPQPSLASPPVKLPLSRRSSSQVTAGQRSPDARRKRDRSHSPPVVRGPSPRGERPRQMSRSRSRSPRRIGRSRSPRRDRRGGVTELASKMSQFMDLMMGQQSLLMSLATARAADEPVGPVANQPMVLPLPLSNPVAQQDAWDVDAISRHNKSGLNLHQKHKPNPGTFDGTHLAWVAPRVLTPLVLHIDNFQDKDISIGVDGKQLDLATVLRRNYDLKVNEPFIEISIPYGAESGYLKDKDISIGVDGKQLDLATVLRRNYDLKVNEPFIEISIPYGAESGYLKVTWVFYYSLRTRQVQDVARF